MAGKHFVVRCLIDGQPHPVTKQPYLLHVMTHGKASHPTHKVIKTKEDALAHFQSAATTHRIEDEDGVRFVSHIDGEGNEHTISEIEEVEEYDPAVHGTDAGDPKARADLDMAVAALMKGRSAPVDPSVKAPSVPPEALAAVLKSKPTA